MEKDTGDPTRMRTVKDTLNKVVILRPGALGDVLAVRGVIRFLKDAFPDVSVCLVAPGERGTFLCREHWADRAFDWDRSAFTWLFSSGEQPPAAALRAVFAGCDLVVSYVDLGDDEREAAFRERLKTLSPSAGAVFCPSRPPPGHGEGIGQWLVRAVAAFCHRYCSPAIAHHADLDCLAGSRIRMGNGEETLAAAGGPYAVLHPGSGSVAKNWPEANYRELGRLLLAPHDGEGAACVGKLVVTSGEADGELGARLAGALPGAVHCHQPSLETLATLLANARLFVGNDSGVSHLAAAVESRSGAVPRVVALFGPSDPSVWAPPGALVLQSGDDMRGLSARDVWREMHAHGVVCCCGHD